MIWHVGDIWSVFDEADLFLFSANSSLNAQGELVMGRGLAKQVKDRFPWAPGAIGKWIWGHSRRTGLGLEYNLAISDNWGKQPEYKVAALQVKYYWGDAADPFLINKGLLDLVLWMADHRSAKVHMNMPGIGNGRLNVWDTMNQVYGILKPFNVHVWIGPQPQDSALRWIDAHELTIARAAAQT